MKKDITLVAIDFLYHDLTKYAIDKTLENLDVAEIVVLSDQEIYPGKTIITEPVKNMSEYANIMLKGVNEYVNTSHALYMQWDGMAYNGSQWTDEFLEYDYIGAPWHWQPEGLNVGNGGFSLRSKRLLEACQDPIVALTEDESIAEDNIIAIRNRAYLESTYGIKYAPTALAKQFSFELGEHVPGFGFHGLWNVFNLGTEADMNYYYPRINYSGWNIYKWHHTLAALIRNGRMDIYEYMLGKLMEESPELLQNIAQWLDNDSKSAPTDTLIIT
jgi:hypothetical protein